VGVKESTHRLILDVRQVHGLRHLNKPELAHGAGGRNASNDLGSYEGHELYKQQGRSNC
jgi:hypothetical protein